MAKSNYLRSRVLNHVLRHTAYTSPTTVYLALFTSVPSPDDDDGTEVSGGSYARQAITFAAPDDNTVTNSADVTFPVATSGWGTITHVGIYDAVSTGNLLYYTALSSSRTILTDDQLRFLTGQLEVGES